MTFKKNVEPILIGVKSARVCLVWLKHVFLGAKSAKVCLVWFKHVFLGAKSSPVEALFAKVAKF